MRRLGFCLMPLLLAPPAVAATYIPPPIMPIPGAWQGRGQAVIRVLDKLDAHIETLTLKAGESGSYKSLSVTVRSCMDRPDGLPADSAAFLDIQDRRGEVQPFSGWTLSGEPAIGVFESPVYAVQLVVCQGDLVAPLAPPLPDPIPAPEGLIPTPAPAPAATPAPDDGIPAAPTNGDDGVPAGAAPVDGSSATPAEPSGPSTEAPPPDAGGQNKSDGAAPDPVYPSGAPPNASPGQPPGPTAPPASDPNAPPQN